MIVHLKMVTLEDKIEFLPFVFDHVWRNIKDYITNPKDAKELRRKIR